MLAQLEQDVLDLNNVSWRQSYDFRRTLPDSKLTKQDEVMREVEAALSKKGSDANQALKAAQEEWSKPETLARVRDGRRNLLAPIFHPMLRGKFHGNEGWGAGFLKSFVGHRISNAVRLIRRYPDIDLFIAATLDVDLWFRGGFHGRESNPSEPLEAQVEMAGKIAVLTEGRVLPRTGFDPLRQVFWVMQQGQNGSKYAALGPIKEEPVTLLQRACEHWGSVGAKLYPVVGFRAWKNMGLGKYQPLLNRHYSSVVRAYLEKTGMHLEPDGLEASRALDAALRKFYTTCNAGRYTVMAHTSHSNGGGDDHENRSAPFFYFAASEDFPNVRFDLGHFGGLGSTKANFSNQAPMKQSEEEDWNRWPEEIAKYFRNSGRIYADLAYIGPGNVPPVENLAYFLEKFPASRRKILYGSDWHELMTSLSSSTYYRDWTRLMDGRFNRHAEGILGQNAADFLGLRQGQEGRKRLENFFAHWQVKADWLPMVDRGRSTS